MSEDAFRILQTVGGVCTVGSVTLLHRCSDGFQKACVRGEGTDIGLGLLLFLLFVLFLLVRWQDDIRVIVGSAAVCEELLQKVFVHLAELIENLCSSGGIHLGDELVYGIRLGILAGRLQPLVSLIQAVHLPVQFIGSRISQIHPEELGQNIVQIGIGLYGSACFGIVILQIILQAHRDRFAGGCILLPDGRQLRQGFQIVGIRHIKGIDDRPRQRIRHRAVGADDIFDEKRSQDILSHRVAGSGDIVQTLRIGDVKPLAVIQLGLVIDGRLSRLGCAVLCLLIEFVVQRVLVDQIGSDEQGGILDRIGLHIYGIRDRTRFVERTLYQIAHEHARGEQSHDAECN